MYLKSLEIQGFKSFPDKTVLHFGDDITAIVGPNGSGKSNISDAIRWVMGEQSTRALRGAKMEDVIFGGTQKRAQVGFAEATLVLDNSDGAFKVDAKEVMVTRRYYRSGDSEFYINKQSARLRDINELFMDTGLGREGYSNISQGKIDEILAVRSVDRREIFEEAAGISKYRHRKEETERRLAATQDNLMRIGDKISELELQVEPLRAQADKAKKYLAWREELKGLEVAVWLQTLERLGEAAKKAEADFNSAAFILQQEHDALDALYAAAEQHGAALRQQDGVIDQLREKISAMETESGQYDAQIAVLSGSVENNTGNMTRIRQELADAEHRSGGMDGQIREHEARIRAIEAETAALAEQLEQLERQSKRLSDSADELTRSYLQLTARQSTLQAELSGRRADKAAVAQALALSQTRRDEVQRDTASAQARLTEAEQKQAACRRALQDARDEVTAAGNTISGYQLRLQARAKRRDELQEQGQQLRVRLDTTDSRIAMFREMEKDYEGYSKAVKYVMQQAQRGALQRIHGPLSALIRTRDEYTVAIEIAMGAAMQQIVVDDQQAGKAAIARLKHADSGRATFLPISEIRGKRLQEPGLEQLAGFVGIASELVECGQQYRQIVENILGRTVVVETMDDAVAAAQRYHQRLRLVTLDGQVINAGGSMTGGSVSRKAGILSRANELQRLEQQREQLAAQLEQQRAQWKDAQSAAAQVEFELSAAQGQLRQAEDEVLRLEGEQRQHEVLISALRDAIAGSDRELQALAQRTQADEARQTQLGEEIAAQEQELAALTAQLNTTTASQSDALDRANALTQQLTDGKMQRSALQAERQSAEAAIAQLRQLQAQMAGDRTQKQSLLDRYEAENTALQGQIASVQALKADHLQALAEQRGALQQAIGVRAETEAQKTKAEHDAQGKNKDILNMERESARLEQKKLAAQMEEKQIVDKLWDSYELTRSTAPAVAAKLDSLTGAQRTITDLKRKISALGTPNLGAIEEFERVNERYEYLSTQRDDVLQAKADLELIIHDITEQMTQIFVEEFDKINTFFGQTFVEMFGGGKGSLVLEDPADPLGCGIEIRVQPPGKQLKTITLLSGGEKAFVAIALYFAILKVRPTPFCMLDEIDAALDDRNVERYASYLRTLCKKTQFIVITHRRGTMEEADILYGVTMQEQGVSKILHLDLNQMVQQLGITE